MPIGPMFYKRLGQSLQLLRSQKLKTPQSASLTGVKKYSYDREVDYYSQLASAGLWKEERQVLREALKRLECSKSALVLGCGAGREAFALQNEFPKVVGLDLSSLMIDRARTFAQDSAYPTKFICEDLRQWQPEQRFDLIFVSEGLLNHIPYTVQRQVALKRIKDWLAPQGLIITSPDVYQPALLSPLALGSWYLKYRWGNDWEPGDHLRSHFSPQAKNHDLAYYHFYPTPQHFLREIHQARLKPVFHIEGVYLLQAIV